MAKQLTRRSENRETLSIADEYDVQDLLHALLRLSFDIIRPEEYIPRYAGGAFRIDFLLKPEQILIEVKKTRSGLRDKELGQQLILDIAHYRVHPDCKMLIAFVYDPDRYIENPQGLEADLSHSHADVLVRVIVVQ